MKMIINRFIIILFALIFLNTAVYCEEEDFFLIDAPAISQYPTLPTGCEVTATTMLLQWKGIEVTKEDLADNIVKGEKPYSYEDGLYGGNPEIEFVGSPYDPQSFGVYNVPIYNLVNSYLPDRAVDLTGNEFDDVLKFLQENDTPVVVWATTKMLPILYEWEWIEENTWTIHKWKGNEHALLLVGYTEESIIVNDPHTGKQEYYNREIFKQRWEEIGKKAVSVTPKKETIIETDGIDEKSKETLKDQFKHIVDIIDGKFWVLVQKIKFI